tara:strand:+ start:587 stop:865 length:279 start_codon:yes stop_codon:yes gene_type:complete
MATKNPRVAITLPEETKRLYERAGELMGVSASKYIASILTEASPGVQELIALLEKRGEKVDTLVGLSKLSREVADELQTDLVDEIAAQKTRK